MEKGSEKSYDKWGFLILCLKGVAEKKIAVLLTIFDSVISSYFSVYLAVEIV